LLVFQEFDCHVAKWLVGKILGDVGEIGRDEAGVAVDEVELDGIASLDLVRNVGCTQCDEEVVVAMPMHERRLVRRNLDFENANLIVFESEMVRWLCGDFNFGGLGEERERRENEDCSKGRAMHDVDCNAGLGSESLVGIKLTSWVTSAKC